MREGPPGHAERCVDREGIGEDSDKRSHNYNEKVKVQPLDVGDVVLVLFPTK